MKSVYKLTRLCIPVVAVFALVLATSSVAKADTATITNVSGLNVTVTFGVSGPTLTVSAIDVNGGDTVKSINEVGWQNEVSFLSTTSDGNWSDTGSKNIDGFDTNPWNTATGTGNVTNGGLASWTFSGDPGTDFIFHVQYTAPDGAGCSTWVSNTSHTGGLDAPNPASCGTQIPEPGSLMLFGTGLIGIAGFLRRKLTS